MKIVLDADGVLLDYNEKMARVYEKALGKTLCVVKESHHFTTMYGVVFTPEDKKIVFALFDTEGWTNMPAIKGSVKATQALHDAGHELVCLSSMPAQFVEARTSNFKSLGIPLEKVIGSGRDDQKTNPKAVHLIELQPDIFVDDQLRNFKDVPDSICKVWIDNKYHDSPDVGLDTSLADFKFHSLSEFAQVVLENPSIFKKNKKSLKL